MAQLSVYSANALVNWISGVGNMPAATTVYLSLWNGDPESGGAEITSTVSAGRIALTSMSTSSAGAGSSTNSSALTWTSSATGGGTLTYLGGSDASTSGNLLWKQAISSNVINTGNAVQMLAGGLTITAGGDESAYSMDYLVNWMTGTASFPAATARYLSLWNGASEVTATIRPAGRLSLSGLIASASGKAAANTSIISFGNAATGASITLDAIYDAATSGNLIRSKALTGGTQTISTGNPVSYQIGSFVLQAS
jgi:hypothetical protein